MNDDDKGTEGTHLYDQPASQNDRRRMLKQDAAARTYFDIANGDFDAEGRTPVTGANAFGPMLPAPAWSHDPTGKEPPLGEDVNALPDMRACWWIPGAVAPGEEPSDA